MPSPINPDLLAADWWFTEGHRLTPKDLNGLLQIIRSLAEEVEVLRSQLQEARRPAAEPVNERRVLDHNGNPEDT